MPRLKKPVDNLVEEDTILYTTSELAKKLKMTGRTLVTLRIKGGGPRFYKSAEGKGGRVLYDWKDVLVWIESRKRNSTSDTGDNR